VNLRDVGEGTLIRKIREKFARFEKFNAASVPIGIGDDAAVFDLPPGHSAVFCSDLVAENTHFIRNLHPPDSIGYKAVAVNVSDVGAMGGVPMHFLISLAAPGDLDFGWVEAFFNGVERACRDFKLSLLGGDSSSSELIFVDVSMVGRVSAGRAIRRSGAKPGDSIYVTGTLGSSALGLERLKAGRMNDPAVQRHLYPEPRHRVGAAVADRAHAMIDVSDGLSTDLPHILEESKVSARIYKDRLPAGPGVQDQHLLHGGEEYELLITGRDLPATIEGVPLTRIGEIIESGLENQLFLIDGTLESVLSPHGWQHFG
jgi:thiamine-monophosphate kinase